MFLFLTPPHCRVPRHTAVIQPRGHPPLLFHGGDTPTCRTITVASRTTTSRTLNTGQRHMPILTDYLSQHWTTLGRYIQARHTEHQESIANSPTHNPGWQDYY